eukprot:TRINITY_DN2772_c0_g1_i1.p1 TRINITY_DN2772_c0_g1~~TRINITY_DN2772_c0_g1_i1.p1  ORF type:complete len:556 (-),score=160.31 TRINITY_DN2772_c0_g1_i1:157-1746(-)
MFLRGFKSAENWKEIGEKKNGFLKQKDLSTNTASYRLIKESNAFTEPFVIQTANNFETIKKTFDIALEHCIFTDEDIGNKEEQQLLGSGCFGSVYKAKIRNQTVAIKYFNATDDSNQIVSFLSELEIISKIKHNNFLAIRGGCISPNCIAIVMEYISSGTIQDLINHKKIELCAATNYLKQIAEGMAWLHDTYNIGHFDLKPGNLLIDENIVKIADFGISKTAQFSTPGHIIGTCFWIAPEILMEKPYDLRADLYSFGIIIWQLLTQEIDPYGVGEGIDSITRVVVNEKQRPNMDIPAPEAWKNLMVRCLDENADIRIPFSEMVRTDIFKEQYYKHRFWFDSTAAEIWNKATDERVVNVVSWGKLVSALLSILNLSQYTNLIFVEKNIVQGNSVQLDTFVKFARFTAPFDREWINFINKMVYSDCHGFINAGFSRTILIGKTTGSFLIRFSNSYLGCYVVDFVDEKGAIQSKYLEPIEGEGRRLIFKNGGKEEEYEDVLEAMEKPKEQLGTFIKFAQSSSIDLNQTISY